MAQPEVPQGRDDAPAHERRSGERIAAPPGAAARLRAAALALASPKARVRAARRLLAPVVLALVPLFWVVDATHRASLTTLGRDQGIFQYVAWAVGLGDVDYRDIRDVNGPLIHLVHAVMLALGGADEHRFRVLDLWATGLSFAFVGACIPGLVARARVTWLERAAWAAAAWVVLGAQYHLYLYWNQAQRESFCDWFLLPSLALQLAAPPRGPDAARSAARRVVAIAALSVVPWFGKPSYLPFTVMQLGVLLIDRELPLARRDRLSRFALGGALGAVVPLLYLVLRGDLLAFLRISLVDVPRVYRFIWVKSPQEIFGEEGPLLTAVAAVACASALGALVSMRELPRRALVVALAPLCGLVNVLVQHKGFGYHFHPVTASTHAGWLVLVAMLGERFRATPRSQPLGRYAALGAAAVLAVQVATSMKGSPHTRNVWILAGGETPERRQSPEYFATFRSHDFFPWELREGARYLAKKTSPEARVQVYGMDPYLLFLARRRSATPYIYAYDLNASAALEGGWSARPDDAQAAAIRETRDAHERDMLDRLRAAPPEAFVFIDRAPLTVYPDSWEDFQHCCAESAAWVAAHYHPAKTFGEVHVWMRDDLRARDPEGEP